MLLAGTDSRSHFALLNVQQMSAPYEEIIEGKTVRRPAPGPRHELICSRLHSSVQASVQKFPGTRLLEPRSRISFSAEIRLCPDLSLIASATGKLWLAAEIVNTDDHRVDTVFKKQLYEDLKLPRLWMIDPRYDNVEIYHATEYGLVLKGILAGAEILSEKLLPDFQMTMTELFGKETA
jgi:Uma2 family endonuclease